MRIAYIAPYQGPELLKRRPSLSNLALAGNLKTELVAELLQSRGHELEILSQGEVVERRFRYYPPFTEARGNPPRIPVHYASAIPIRFVNGVWPTYRTVALFKRRHRVKPYDLVIIYNLQRPQVMCARYAITRLNLPVVLEYEDDAFVDVFGKKERRLMASWHSTPAAELLPAVAACIGVSPFLLSRVPEGIPKLLLRGVVSQDILNLNATAESTKKNWIAFSGTHFRSKGLEPLVTAWHMVNLPGWELHIAGAGELTAKIERMANGHRSIVFHGLLNRAQNAEFLTKAKIGINPHDLSDTPGNVFAFKIIEYLAAGSHVISTPMGPLEPELEAGVTYMPDNSPETIAATLTKVITERRYSLTAMEAAHNTYGPAAVAQSLDALLTRLATAI